MPLPLILGIAAGIAALGGVAAGVKGASDMSEANDTLKRANARDKRNKTKLKKSEQESLKMMDNLGNLEMVILSSFQTYSDCVEQIKQRPSFADINIGGYKIPKFEPEKIKEVSVGAAAIVGGLSGAALGTAGAFAASGATTAAVMALGTASTGAAISSLSGAAAVNASLAALGGGSLAVGGGGMALGTTILGASTLGVGLLVGGIIFSVTGSNMKDKADEAMWQVMENEEKINEICAYLDNLKDVAMSFFADLSKVNDVYQEQLKNMVEIVKSSMDRKGNVYWSALTPEQRTVVKNTTSLVGLLYELCKVKLVKKSDSDINTVNSAEVQVARDKCQQCLASF